jgi:pimeloyl-ACP methyl ester carboxylesterase
MRPIRFPATRHGVPHPPSHASQRLRAFAARGRHLDYDGHALFVIDAGEGDEAVVFLHGFPGSAFDFAEAIDRVAAHHRVVALDFLGYGLSGKPLEMGLSLFELADSVEVVLARLGIRRAHLVAHDMGTTVALELCARRRLGLLSFTLASVLFTNGSVFVEMTRLTPSQKLLRVPVVGGAFARVASFTTFRLQIARISGRPISEEATRDMFELMVCGGGRRVLPKLIGYIDERWRFAERWVGHLGAVDVPTTVLWGQRDPVAVPAIGARLAHALPICRELRLDDVGHFSPLEAPAELAEATLEQVARSR